MVIFSLKTLCIIYFYKIQFNDNDSSHHDSYQEGQEDQEFPLSLLWLLSHLSKLYLLSILKYG